MTAYSAGIIEEIRDLERAEARVARVVGPVVNCDSAEEVYRAALKKLGHNVATLRGKAAEVAFNLVDGTTHRQQRDALAMGSAVLADRERRFGSNAKQPQKSHAVRVVPVGQ
jgi:hypothetical protein